MRKPPKRKKPFRIVLIVLAIIIASNFGARYIIAENNYAHNKSVGINVSSADYREPSYFANFKFSLNNSVENYTAIAATYNAIRYLKNNSLYTAPINVPDMIRHFDMYGQLGFGTVGMNFFAVESYLKKLGIETKIQYGMDNIADKLNNCTIAIMFRTDFKSMQDFRAVRYESVSRIYFFGPLHNALIQNTLSTYGNQFMALITLKVNEPIQ